MDFLGGRIQPGQSSGDSTPTQGVYWIGQDGNVWASNGGVATNYGKPIKTGANGAEAELGSVAGFQIADPNPGGDGGGGGFYGDGGGGEDAAQRDAFKAKISQRGGQIDAIYQALFGDLDKLIRSRSKELESQYGDQLKSAADQYAGAIPEIEGSYAAIGSADSTDQSDAKTKAKKGFDETTKTIGKNKEVDEAKLGQYRIEQRAKFGADRDSAKRAVASANDTTDVDALRSLYNDLDSNLSATGVTRATLSTDGSARDNLTKLTGDNGRYEAATNALDQILKSSMSGAVKQAAVSAVTDSAGLSDEEKKKVQQTYGNVYAEQAAL